VSKQLTHVQRLACLYITGAMRTTPTAAMELLVGLVPLPTFIQQETMMAYYRLCAASQWLAGGGEHAKISQKMVQLIPLSQACCDRRVAKYYFDKYFTVQIPSREQWITQQIILSDEIICFTDGSRRGLSGPSGAGVYTQDDNQRYMFPLGSDSTGFQTELFAILSCATLPRLQEENGASMTICSDSQAALKALEAAKVTSNLVAEVIEAVNKVSICNSVRLLWVPGHCGVPNLEIQSLDTSSPLFI